MNEIGIGNIITQLERQRNAIDQALEALRGIQGIGTGTPTSKKRGRPPGTKTTAPKKKQDRKRRMSPEGRERIAAASRKRWADKRAAEAEAAAKKATKKRGPAKSAEKKVTEESPAPSES